MFHLTGLPLFQNVGPRAYILQQRAECKGTKVYDIDNVQDMEQCREACRRFDCAGVNLFQLDEFVFKCEILNYISHLSPATGAACYYASDVWSYGGKYNLER
uniref:Apple domain-containing protein n=1 Tax=Angiostrongylus cantonensis TaxID=6313 RepID=A0A0K0DRA7_ANGCA